jgi:hypothetical protein
MNHNGDGYAVNPFSGPAAYTEKAKALSVVMSSAWINFVVSQDPNGKEGRLGRDLTWPVYDPSVADGVGEEIVWTLGGSHVGTDDYRKEGMEWLILHMLDVFGM